MTHHNHEHDHDHGCGCGQQHNHQRHDANVTAHCHCGSCAMQHNQSSGDTNGQDCGGQDHGDGCCGCSDDSGGGDSESDSHCPGGDDHDHGDGCGCGHDHEHGEDIQPRTLWRLGIGAAVFVAALLTQELLAPVLTLLVFLAGYLIIGGDVLLRAAKNILRGQIFDENFLMAIATIGAFAIGEYPEGIAVMLFYQVGELFQSYAVGRSRRSIAELMDIRPDHANLALPDGGTQTVAPDTVQVGAEIIIKPGEKIPLDSEVLEGSSFVDTAALTGESVPRSVAPGDTLFSGCINQTGLLRAKVTKEFGQSTVSKILELAENASSKKAKAQQFITRFAKVYTPLVVLAAVLLAVIPPFFTGLPFSHWLGQALVFLVISCPCALVISVPLSFFGGIGGASRCGVLVKGGNHLEALAHADLVVFDKTGTLTKGVFEVTQLQPQGVAESELLAAAAGAERFSTHPIARSIVAAWTAQGGSEAAVSDYQELAGRGVSALVSGQLVLAGNRRLMEENNITLPKNLGEADGTQVLVAREGRYLGRLVISDRIKEDAAQAIGQLRSLGVRRTVMLTGDAQSTAQSVAKQVGVDDFYAQLLPGDKVDHLERLLEQRSQGGSLVFVGDGINDAPVLARADVGVAMGALGSDAAIEAADVVLMTDQPTRLAAAIRVARKTMAIVRQNVVMALGIKLVVMVLGIFGVASMWLAVFADVGVSILAILNAIRALNTKKLL